MNKITEGDLAVGLIKKEQVIFRVTSIDMDKLLGDRVLKVHEDDIHGMYFTRYSGETITFNLAACRMATAEELAIYIKETAHGKHCYTYTTGTTDFDVHLLVEQIH